MKRQGAVGGAGRGGWAWWEGVCVGGIKEMKADRNSYGQSFEMDGNVAVPMLTCALSILH